MIDEPAYRFRFVLTRGLGVWSSLTVRSAPSLPVSRLRDKNESARKNVKPRRAHPSTVIPSRTAMLGYGQRRRWLEGEGGSVGVLGADDSCQWSCRTSGVSAHREGGVCRSDATRTYRDHEHEPEGQGYVDPRPHQVYHSKSLVFSPLAYQLGFQSSKPAGGTSIHSNFGDHSRVEQTSTRVVIHGECR